MLDAMSSLNSNSSSSSSSSSSFLSDYRRYDDEESGKKLSFLSFPAKLPPPEPPGAMTPPLQTAASVPFRWEEAPGKPRARNDTSGDKNDVELLGRCLELPPRLLVADSYARITNMSSPTTVLDGPDVGRSLAYGVTFRSFRSPESLVKKERAGYFGSSRWGGSFRKINVGNREFLGVEGSNDFSHVVVSGDGEGDGAASGGGGEKVSKVKVKIKRSTRSHLWGSIYETLKQAVPWKRKERVRK